MRTALLICLLGYVYASIRCDSEHICPDEATCCKLRDGEWGCCPMEKAVCCSDHIHCCPNGMKCDVSGARCTNGIDQDRQLGKKYPAIKSQANEHNEIICPGGADKCPDGNTCCLLNNGRYGCCPAVGATCCADHLHCCPHGMKCDSTGQRCSNGIYFEKSLKKFAATPIRPKPAVGYRSPAERKPIAYFEQTKSRESRPFVEQHSFPSPLKLVKCGPNQVCSSQTTCCESEVNGEKHYMCCPLKNGICCKNTCCPHGYHCLANDRCERKAVYTSWIEPESNEEEDY